MFTGIGFSEGLGIQSSLQIQPGLELRAIYFKYTRMHWFPILVPYTIFRVYNRPFFFSIRRSKEISIQSLVDRYVCAHT